MRGTGVHFSFRKAGAASPAHPVAWHGLDVDAAFAEPLRIRPRLKEALVGAFVEEAGEAVPALLVLVALHDVGKFAATFQARIPEAYPACLGASATSAPAFHDRIGFALAESRRHLAPLLQAIFAANDLRYGPIPSAIFGHHGQPIEPDKAR